MLDLGIIKESHSGWRSSILLVPKMDGSTRFCIDFRKVNALSRFDTYPMLRVEELLEKLRTTEYISTLDMMKGYWHSPLSAELRE